MAQVPSYFLCLCRMAEAVRGATDLWSQPDLCSFLCAVLQLALHTLKSSAENWITYKGAKKGAISSINNSSTDLSGGFQCSRIHGTPQSH